MSLPWAEQRNPVNSSVFCQSPILPFYEGLHKGLPQYSCLAGWLCTEAGFKCTRGKQLLLNVL